MVILKLYNNFYIERTKMNVNFNLSDPVLFSWNPESVFLDCWILILFFFRVGSGSTPLGFATLA